MDAINLIAIILSVVSLIVTVVGFFASLRFYRDGVALQTLANDALVKIQERTQLIQTQVGGMFDKTLDAAIGRRNELAANVEALDVQVGETHKRIVDEALHQIGVAGEQERSKLAAIVDEQFKLIRDRIENTRETAEDIVSEPAVQTYPRSETQAEIMSILAANPAGVSFQEIVDRVKRPAEHTRVALGKLQMRGVIKLKATRTGACIRYQKVLSE